jgi:3-oxoacyl-[acyl-carrier-protein] synthase-3
MCEASARKLLEGLSWNPEEVQLLVFVSQTRDYFIPQTSGILQHKLGLPKSCISLDIGLGCSGYVYGLSVMGSMMNSMGIKKGLLLVGDISSLNSAYRDKSTYPLFGDAGTATAIELDSTAHPISFNLQGDGAGHKAIIIPDGGMRHILTKKSFEYKKIGPGIHRTKLHVALDGIEVFNFSLREVVPNIKELLGFSKHDISQFDYLIFHQANKLINETLRKMLKVDKSKVPLSITKFGNTSSASIPLTLVSELQSQLQSGKVNLLLAAFGIGLSWGSATVETSQVFVPDLIEL